MLMSMVPAAYANDTESTGVDDVSISEDNVKPYGDETKTQTATGNIVTANGIVYATLEEALEEALAAAEPDENGVITYQISGKAEVNAAGWVQVAKDGLTSLSKVKFVGITDDAEICITGDFAILADQTHDIDVSFTGLKLSKPNPAYGGDYGHSTNYFTCWLRNINAAENTVTYTNCTFPNGVCNNRYGKTVFDNCQFTNNASGLYNLWNYGGNTEIKNSTFTGVRGIKTYNEGSLEVAPTVTVENTAFNGLTEKAAIVASKATNITLTGISATGCAKGFFQKDIEGSSDAEKVTIAANGSGISGTFNVTAEKTAEAAKNELNITSGKLEAVTGNSLSDLNDYLADNFTISEDGTVTESPSTTYVAEVGGMSYATLAEAIAAAKDGDTVTLLADCNGNGIQIKTETFATNGLTVDFGDHSYTVGGMLVGSAGTGTNAFQLFEGGKVTFKNGKIIGVAAGTKPAEDTPNWHGAPAIMLQNYCDLTLYEMEVVGGDQTVYTMSNNHGNVVIENSTIKAGGAKGFPYGPYAFDVCGYSSYTGVSVTVRGTSVINGDIEVSRSADNTNGVKLALESGTVTGKLKIDSSIKSGDATTITKSSDVILAAPEGYEWSTNGTLTEANYVAEVNGKKYETLQAAVNAAARKATVKLLADTKENVTISTPYVTLDLNGHTLNGSTGERKPALTITARVTVMDSSAAQTGTIMREDTAENSGVSSHYVIDIQGAGWLTFESGTVKNGSGAGGTKGASLVRVGDEKVAKFPGLNIKGGTFTQDNFIVIKVERGDLFLNGGTLNSANSYAVENWHRATIKGGTVNGAVSSWTYSDGANSTLEISGGTVNGNVEAVSYDGSAGKKASVSISGGTVNGRLIAGIYNSATEPTKDMATIEVTGGTFSSDPSKYVVENSSVTQNGDGTYGVAKAFLAKVGDTSYYTMDEAFKAQTASGEPIVLLRDYTTGSTFNSGTVARVVDLNGHTWTCTGTDANSAAFEINNPNASLTVKNGKIVSSQLVGLIPSAMGGTITYDNSILTFDGVEMSTTATSGIETNGNNTDDSVTLKNSTLNVPNGFGIYFPSSGTLTIDNSIINAKTMGVQVCAGNLNINDGSKITVSGDAVPKTDGDGAIQDGAAISIVNRTGYKGLGVITVTGGTFTAKSNAAIKAYKWENQAESAFDASNKVSVSGGTFSSIPDNMNDLCADGYIPVKNEDGYAVQTGTYVASIGTKNFATLADAIAAAKDSDTVTLLADTKEDVTINKNITLDLNGKTLTNTNAGKATISVTSGTATVKGGNVVGGTSYYNIEVKAGANLTLEEVTATAGNTGSSMIDNWGTLTISSGDYTGGLNVVKSEEGSTLTINGGKFTLSYATNGYTGVIFAYGTTTITGGEFIQSLTTTGKWNHPQVILAGVVEGYTSSVKVTGGSFTNKMLGESIFRGVGKATSDNFEVSGGTFNKSISDGYCADGFIPTKNADGTYGVKEGKYVAAVGSKKYETLADAIRLAAKGKTVTLLVDTAEDITIAANKRIPLDLNGKTLTNKVGHTITVEAGASLTITGKGTVDNVTHAKAAIVNYGTVVLNGGIYTRSLENAENNKNDAGGNSYYTILNDKGGHMTINEGVTVTNVGHFSSMIRNGGDEKSTEKSTLIITGGTFSGGINTIKNDEFGVLEIKGGSFSNTSQYVVMNWNKADISGGTFEANATAEAVLFTAAYLENRAVGELTITGGSFKTASDAQELIDDTYGADYVGTAAISGGSFSKLVEQKWCALGYEPNTEMVDGMYGVQKAEGNAAYYDADGNLSYGKLETLLRNAVTGSKVIVLENTTADYIRVKSGVTLDLNGKKVTVEGDMAVSTGTIIDSGKGEGALVVSMKALTTSGDNGGYLPLYDSANKAYHFYKAELSSYGKSTKEPGKVKFYFRLLLDEESGYQYFAQGNSHGVEVYVRLRWDGLPENQYWYVPMTAGTMNGLSQNGSNYYMYAYLTGIKILGNVTIYGKPVIKTEAGYTSDSTELSYQQVLAQ